jgi:hypothetical protein
MKMAKCGITGKNIKGTLSGSPTNGKVKFVAHQEVLTNRQNTQICATLPAGRYGDLTLAATTSTCNARILKQDRDRGQGRA